MSTSLYQSFCLSYLRRSKKLINCFSIAEYLKSQQTPEMINLFISQEQPVQAREIEPPPPENCHECPSHRGSSAGDMINYAEENGRTEQAI